MLPWGRTRVSAEAVEWSGTQTGNHAVDCVDAPAVFLAPRGPNGYLEVRLDLTRGADATPAQLVSSASEKGIHSGQMAWQRVARLPRAYVRQRSARTPSVDIA